MKHSEEAKRKMSLSRIGNKNSLGHIPSEETKRKISETKKGRKQTEEHKQSIRSSLIGRRFTEEWKKKIGLGNTGENNGMWKGDGIGMITLHHWIRRHKPKPEYCEICNNTPPIDVANISGKYLRDVNDFQWLCRSCHMKSDGRVKNLEYGRTMINNFIDMSDRRCSICGRGTYIIKRTGRPHWRYIDGRLSCNKCYMANRKDIK